MTFKTRDTCRVSGGKINHLWDLGSLYLSHFYDEITLNAPRAPLRIGIGEESNFRVVAFFNQDILIDK